METADLIAGLMAHLEGQKVLFQTLGEVQSQLLKHLDASQDLTSVLALLSQKNQLLDQVHQNNIQAATYVAEWSEARKRLGASPEVHKVNGLLEEVESLAQAMRSQDEEMIKRFEKMVQPNKPVDRTERTNNLLNAFRALR